MTTTLTQAIDEVADQLDSARRSGRTTLSAAISSTSATTCTVASASQIRAGDFIDIDLELIFVVSVSGTTLTIIRGERSSTAATHLINAVVRIQPRWWKHKIQGALLDEIQNLPPDVYAVTTVPISFGASTPKAELTGVAANSTPIRLLETIREPAKTASRTNHVPLILVRDVNGGTWASGWGLMIDSGWTYNDAQTVWVTYAHTFDVTTSWALTTDLEADVGLSPRLIDAVKYGAIWRIQSTRELTRLQTHAAGEARIAKEVPALSNAKISTEFRKIRDQLIDAEREWLLSNYGVRAAP